MRRVIVIVAVLVLGLAIAGYVFFNGERKVPVRYRTVAVERGTVISLVTATGTINPITTIQVGSQVSGMIESLHADFNSRVKANQVVARIDPFPYQARRDQAAASLANAKAAWEKARIDLAQRRRELDRAKSLIGQQFISQNEVDVALTASEGALAQLKVTEAAVKQAEAMLQAAELDLKYTVIRSPVDGVVISRQVEVGQRISASFSIPTLFLIAENVTKMQVDTNVSEADIGGIAEGKAATFTVDAYPGEPFHGRVRQVRNAPINVQNVVTYDVVVEFDNPDFRLKPGMTANVSIVIEKREQVLKVPSSALRFTPPKAAREEQGAAVGDRPSPTSGSSESASRRWGVWKVEAGNDLERVPVEMGISDRSYVEVTAEGLREGDHVVVGIDAPRGERKGAELPPGFGSGQQRSGRRDRGL
ncbi:MAG TPA: efflux RND transporter periplasmic adaptor subunit [Nitrospira sp.]|nr:efflux RND transporter periplasmic adaptor subunit [Nitrospira sp.]MBS0174728.1 efflux RND transporter periplasmic adaptor subunit [Nitrospira sp.]MBX3338460.1 efflux RND transporter periplasmic adaptor subunit [Nitrospira sp.]MCW5779155.1 efflux RND transporter periplasmic adaptor subunit [Nitrospira sp.]HNI67489.1 efflux RND transporter periplasmic adaptor subunit [Nitrospira sp.]